MIEVKCKKPGRGLGPFLRVVDDVYAGVPAYARPLDVELGLRLGPLTPFARHSDFRLLTAYSGERCVGRCTVQFDPPQGDRLQAAGYFGYVDTIDDLEVMTALVERARSWLGGRGVQRFVGPVWSGWVEPRGVLVHGFEHPPMIKTSYHLPHQSVLLEAAGLAPAGDLLAWRFEVGSLPRRAKAAFERIGDLPEVYSRTLDPRHVDRDLDLVMRLVDDIDQGGPQHVGIPRSRRATARELKRLLVPELSRLVYVDGEVAAAAVTIPNANEVIRDLGGSVSGVALAKLLFRMKMKHPESARVALFGVHGRFLTQERYRGLGSFLRYHLDTAAAHLGYRWAEVSVTWADDRASSAVLRRLGGRPYRRFRLYEGRA